MSRNPRNFMQARQKSQSVPLSLGANIRLENLLVSLLTSIRFGVTLLRQKPIQRGENIYLDTTFRQAKAAVFRCSSSLLAGKRLDHLGRLPFLTIGRTDWYVRKWNVPVLRTERTGSGQAHEVGPLSSLGPARTTKSVRLDV